MSTIQRKTAVHEIIMIIRLFSQGISQRSIAVSCECSRNTVANVLKRSQELNLTWPLNSDMTSGELQKLLFPESSLPAKRKRPDCEYIHARLAVPARSGSGTSRNLSNSFKG